MNAEQPHVPPISEPMREEARRNPGGWIYAVDPAFDPGGEVPPYGIVGAWRVDDRGEITGEFKPNPNYRPSPRALELPPATDPLDEAVQLAATGHGPESRVRELFLEREVYLFDLGGGVIHVVDDDRGPKVQVFSSEEHLPQRDQYQWQRLRGRDLAARVAPGCDIEINPGGRVKVRIPGGSLR